MADDTPSVLERVKQPEYTGDNRCLPCTVGNLAFAVILGVAIWPFAPLLAPVVVVASVLLIYLRGYLVPGTPELTKQYLPESVAKRFDHQLEPTTDTEGDAQWDTIEKLEYERRNAVDPEEFLLDAGVIELTPDETNVQFSEAFETAVVDAVSQDRSTDVDSSRLADLFDVEPAVIEVKDRSYPTISIDGRIRKWPTDAALAVELAAHAALHDRTDEWMDVPLEQRLSILESLRTFVSQCPFCSAAIVLNTDTVESCCRAYDVATLECDGCDRRYVELDPSVVDDLTSQSGVPGDAGVVRDQ
ncbi:hypothetical protein G6M89_12190 [Natronolimnobius sp. AArcel1]|uniref:hypothetical protein n=1 Tax=Natronolimnobius sp. AArcel1 TaxID=1679093 RepID=UPI0013EB4412|nr:hypothetical protein [Natronolimnobius sp. AArcel1]NGM69759.1 hypothetical protein [Natronolimnobius sp. AArcel1]